MMQSGRLLAGGEIFVLRFFVVVKNMNVTHTIFPLLFLPKEGCLRLSRVYLVERVL
jgi:hypothetical protein